MSNNPTNQNEPTRPSQAVASFIAQAKSPTKLPGKPIESRIIFGLDATASREPTWDQASQIQHEMFATVQSDQRLAVQLCFYRGFRELKASRFCHSATELQGSNGPSKMQGRPHPNQPTVEACLKDLTRRHPQSRVVCRRCHRGVCR